MTTAATVRRARSYRFSLHQRSMLSVVAVMRLWQALVNRDHIALTHAAWLARATLTIQAAAELERDLAARWLAVDVAARTGQRPDLPPLPPTAFGLPMPAWDDRFGSSGDVAPVDLSDLDMSKAGLLNGRVVSIGERLRVSLPATLARVSTGMDPNKALDEGSRVAGSMALTVIDRAAQNAYDEAVAREGQAVGWARITSAGCCSWCSMLAARGPVFRTKDSAGFEAHRHCQCVGAAVLTGEEFQRQRWTRAPGKKSVWVPNGPVKTLRAKGR